MWPHSHIPFSVNSLTGTYTAGMHPCGCTSSWIHGHLYPMLQGCVPMVIFHFGFGCLTGHSHSTLGHHHPPFCPLVIFKGTYTLCYRAVPVTITCSHYTCGSCSHPPTLALDPPTIQLSPPALGPKTHKRTVARHDTSISSSMTMMHSHSHLLPPQSLNTRFVSPVCAYQPNHMIEPTPLLDPKCMNARPLDVTPASQPHCLNPHHPGQTNPSVNHPLSPSLAATSTTAHSISHPCPTN